ncbi:UNVERIFIED_CONTAM: hypothetical protein PYX00_010209 [Menopon gallinae]|uniref:SAM domain-containing protein n=1 Tax=Menopon gallinae TaxID=328185 RepID=A0AAW2HEH3_9NEOP
MIESKARGNVAAVVANLEKSRKTDFSKKSEFHATKDEKAEDKGGKSGKSVPRAEEARGESLRDGRETGNSVRKRHADDSNSSPEESTVKHTWSGSGSPAVLTSESDFSSSSEEDEDEKETKRRSITKDCNADFRWVPTEKQETKALFDTGQKQQPPEEATFFDKKPDSNPFFSMDRNRKLLDYDGERSELVQLRLPPQSPGSLDRKRLSKTRTDRDMKSKSSIITRPGFKKPKDDLGARPDYYYPAWQQCYNEEIERKCCQHFRNKYTERQCCLDHHDYYLHHHQQCCQSPCRSYYGSCESITEKGSRKNGFGSQKNLMKICDSYEDRKNARKSPWRESQHKLFHGSSEYLCQNHCCQLDREKSSSWRALGKNGPDLEDRLYRLENDKESLQLQVTVLTEQVEAQSEKISDLQQSLDDKKQQLNSAEDLLQREILSRSSLETQKLELMSTISELKLQLAAIERENYELKEERKRLQSVKPPMMPRNASPGLVQAGNRYSPNGYANRKSANPFSHQELYLNDSTQSNPFADPHHYISSSTPNTTGSPGSSPAVAAHKRDDVKHYSLTPQPNIRRSMDHYSSLPRQKLLEKEQLTPLADIHRKGVAFGKAKSSLITLKSEKSYSAPNLAETEKLSIKSVQPENPEETVDSTVPFDVKTPQTSSKKGLKKIFIKPDKPFAEWDSENLCNWLEDLGLENYVADLRRWAKNGSQLLAASPHDLEKELGMKNPLHKKKLLLALQEMNDKGPDADELLKPAGCLDTHWVLRWLDDVGLPQHKEVFLTARIDGRMLHRLTMDDLSTLHITSMLHVASLKRGIKVLREHKMDPNCLTRRSVPDEPPPTAADVALWTNHRVMEWLRVVDLAEYAPNLRGSGVHGALMVYETKFTAELLASLLNIPPNKTLLRRHLNTHFKELLGREVIQAKREAETTLGYVPLTPSAKVKIAKKPQFTLKRKKNKTDLDYGDLVCPMDEAPTGEQSASANTFTGVSGDGMMREIRLVPDVCPVTDSSPRDSPLFDRLSRV